MVYDEYPKPSVTVDIVVFTILDGKLNLLLMKRGVEPAKGKWALPGGFVQIDEKLEDAAQRELFQETGVKDIYLEQLYTFGDPHRDSRGRVITVAHFALINLEKQKQELKASTDSIDVKWYAIDNIPELAFDHKKIFEYALKRLKSKLEYSTLAFSLLPDKFTVGQIQKIYEIILDKKFDKRNFFKKIKSLGILKKEEIKKDVSFRPPRLYSLKVKIGEMIEMI